VRPVTYGPRVHPLLAEQAARAAAVLPEDARLYYATGAGEQTSVGEAEAAWAAVRLRPQVLRDVTSVHTGLTLLGTSLRTPVLVGPSALHGLAHPEAEAATARGAAAAGSLTVVSTRASRRLEEVPAGPWWFQAYVMRDRGLTRALVQRAAAAGATAVVLTGDVPYLGRRHGQPRTSLATDPLVNLAGHLADGDDGGRSTEQDPSAGLEAIAELADASGLPVLVKGVLRGDDAVACLRAGAAGVVVSNHGGRQLDRAVATARALPEVVAAVDGQAPVLVDGGLRSGLDVLCALALGADAVLLGRPVLWALAAGGADGVRDCLAAVTDELAHVMGLAGARTLAEVGRDLVAG
jgi:4-hydroxymandelate oxidase